MREIIIASHHAADVEAWRRVARGLLQEHVPPERLHWRLQSDLQADLLANRDQSSNDPCESSVDARVPRQFLQMAASVACHSHSGRWDALYRVLFRLTHGENSLLEVATDPDVHRLIVMNKAVRRDTHKMHAFVRFRAVSQPVDVLNSANGDNHRTDTQNAAEHDTKHIGMDRDRSEDTAERDTHWPDVYQCQNQNASQEGTHYIAWFEPQHHIVQRATPFFARRFVSMRWSILTPTECAHWNGDSLQFTPGVSRLLCPKEDELEDLWRSYYAHIFNPARVAVGTMQAEMPQRYWVNLPEAQLIASLTREAPGRVLRMLHQLDEKPAEIPEDLRSRIGHVLEPDRSRSQQNTFSHNATLDLDVAGAWDPTHDPGVSSARERVQIVSMTQEHSTIAHVRSTRDVSPNCPHQHETPRPFPGTVSVADVPVRVGTASWTDPTLLRRGVFYPDDVTTPEARLHYYAKYFSLVEVDATYYVMPTRAMAAAWTDRSPASFVFDVKAFALMTGHAAEVKRLPDWLRRSLPRSVAANERVYAHDLPTRSVDDVWQRFLNALSPLRDAGKLGPILLQFPRWFRPSRESAETLRTARERLGDASAAVEFRNPEWVSGRIAARTIALLESLNLTYVVVDAPPGTGSSMPPLAPVTTPDLSVVRLHGRRVDTWEARNPIVSERYRYLYDSQELAEWSGRIGSIAERLKELRTSFPDMAKAKQGVHVVFNNCHANYGTSNAIEITKTLIEFDKIRRRLI